AALGEVSRTSLGLQGLSSLLVSSPAAVSGGHTGLGSRLHAQPAQVQPSPDFGNLLQIEAGLPQAPARGQQGTVLRHLDMTSPPWLGSSRFPSFSLLSTHR
ncbi:hypothetical protein H1C71_008046, partial [Ictidomys tridecemlineatus]